MLHEVLATLGGHPGCFFVCDEDNTKVQLLPGLDFLHPAEEFLLQRLCLLGNRYRKIKYFAEQHLDNEEGEGSIYGLYARCFASSLQEVLDPYRVDLREMELEAMKDPHTPLTHLLQLERFLPLFQSLQAVIDKLTKNKTHGCCILEVLYLASFCGLPMVETSMLRIWKNCHLVLLNQLKHWMVRGILKDPYNEFFIGEVGNSEEDSSNRKKQYCLKPKLVPSYIPMQIAEKIFFVGESVSILKPCKNERGYYIREGKDEFSVQQVEFIKMLLELKEMERFSLTQFTSFVAEIRQYTAEQMWKVIVEEADLLGFLKIMKEFYLLGRGELYYIFIDTANRSLKMPLTTSTLTEAKLAFSSAIHRTSLEGDAAVEKFHLFFQGSKENPQTLDKDSFSKTTLETGWSTIGFSCEVPHPLDIIFTPSVLDRYNVILRFLLQVRRVQMELNQCFVLQMCHKHFKRNSCSALLFQMRAHMAFLVDNLQYYLQVDVLDSQFSDLLHKVETIKDFEAIQQAHVNFLVSITSQSFLHLKPVYCCLLDILDLCSAFCGSIIKDQNAFGNKEFTIFENVRLNFQRQTSLLMRILCGIKCHQVSPHLAQFLLRLDFNGYLTSSGGHLGGPQVRKL